ncbi:MAG: ABC transporter ATP-binding protein [Thermodesulfobacteriota bacterium]
MAIESNALLNYLESKPLALRIQQLYKSFSDKQVLKGINLEVNPSETHVILGKSGAGKSVFLKCLVGLESYDRGSVFVNGELINSHGDISKYNIGFVFQSSALFNSMTVSENVGIYLKEHRLIESEEMYNTLVSSALGLVGLEGNENLAISELSGGMKRRVAIARVLVMSPDLILFDEPTTGLDPIMTKTIGELILTLKNTINTTQIVVTHDIDFGLYIADRLSIISEGRIIDVGTPENLKNNDNEVVKNFISTKFDNHGGKNEERI